MPRTHTPHRSIMRIGSLFSGAGGLDMAVERVFNADVAWQCEYDTAASKVLAHRYPGIPNIGDVTTVKWDAMEPVDIMCGGYPCQPFSVAGQRKGTDDERHLWPYFAEAIRRIRPRYVVLENVAGHRSMGFGSVLGDLAAIGYDATWCSVRASDVGAPHRRERLFVLAYPEIVSGGNGGRLNSEGHQVTLPGTVRDLLPTPRKSDGDGGPNPLSRAERMDDVETRIIRCGTSWGKYGPAIRRWESVTRPAPSPTEPNSKGNPRLSAAFSEWLMGWPAGWVTDVPGISRNDMLRIVGNGVCPQQAEAALNWLSEVTHELHVDA